jgi:nicotinamidase-related amidase
VLYKHRYSGLFQTDLDDRLKQLGTRYIIFAGCTTGVCVESTLRDAMLLVRRVRVVPNFCYRARRFL